VVESNCSGLPTTLDLALRLCYVPKGWKLAASNEAEGRGRRFAIGVWPFAV
jgi:hypothetical protein